MTSYNPPKNSLTIFNSGDFNQPNNDTTLEAQVLAVTTEVNFFNTFFSNYGSVINVTLPNTLVSGNLINYPIYTTPILQPGNYIIRVKINIAGNTGLSNAYLYANGNLVYYTYGNRSNANPVPGTCLTMCTTMTYNFGSATAIAYTVNCPGYPTTIVNMYTNETNQTLPLSPYCTTSNIIIMRIT